MSTNTSLMQVSGLEVLVVRKPVKNLHLSLMPPSGRIRITSPYETKEDAIRALVATRLPWIRQHQERYATQERESERNYISGESHFLFGKRYLLELVEEDDVPAVYVKGKKKIVLQVRPNASINKKHATMQDWYRKQLAEVIEKQLKNWEVNIGVKVKSSGIKRMKTKWGTCNQSTGSLWFNLELAKKPYTSIEYVVVHELAHLIEKTHNDRFVGILDKYLPKWRSEKDALNRFILSYEKWID